MQVGLLMANGADEPVSIEHLRWAILDLAGRGRLAEQRAGEEDATTVLRAMGESPYSGSEPWHLPPTWAWASFGSICDSRLGKMLDKNKNTGPLRPYLRNANVQWFRIDLDDVLELRLEDSDLAEYSVREGDLLICEGGEPGRASMVGQVEADLVFQKALHRARPKPGVLASYLLYLLRLDSWSGRLAELFTGATIKHLTGRSLSKYLVPIPPLAEQHRIVAKVDEFMALCDELEEAQAHREQIRIQTRQSSLHALVENGEWDRVRDNWDSLFTTPESVDDLRKAILDLAVRGQLSDQDPQDEPASELIRRIAEHIVAERQSPAKRLPSLQECEHEVRTGWQTCQLTDIALVEMGNSPPGSSYNDSGDGPPLINGPVEFSPSPLGKTSRARFTSEPTKLCRKGDLLVCVRGATTGRTNIASTDACIGRGVALVRAWEAQPFVNLLMWHIGSDLLEMGKGTTFPSISFKDLAGFRVSLPPLAEQHRIVAKVDELMALCDELEARLRKVAEISEQLAESVVHHVAA